MRKIFMKGLLLLVPVFFMTLPDLVAYTPGVDFNTSGNSCVESLASISTGSTTDIATGVLRRNGVPMNDMEWGGLYWSNWAGLSDVTRSMQVQRGFCH